MANVISPKAMSFEEIRSQLIAYIESRPDQERWKDFMSSSAGTILVELLAGMGAFMSYHSIGARRESFIDTALLTSSIYNMSIMLGYNVNRKSAPFFACKK